MFLLYEGMQLSSVQSNFNAVFPYLKLEFFKHHHNVGEANAKKDMTLAAGVIRFKNNTASPKEIAISSDMPVAVLEQLFREQFGLSAQVFRKSGNTWLETSFTDDWSLEKQNREGFELSKLRA